MFYVDYIVSVLIPPLQNGSFKKRRRKQKKRTDHNKNVWHWQWRWDLNWNQNSTFSWRSRRRPCFMAPPSSCRMSHEWNLERCRALHWRKFRVWDEVCDWLQPMWKDWRSLWNYHLCSWWCLLRVVLEADDNSSCMQKLLGGQYASNRTVSQIAYNLSYSACDIPGRICPLILNSILRFSRSWNAWVKTWLFQSLIRPQSFWRP